MKRDHWAEVRDLQDQADEYAGADDFETAQALSRRALQIAYETRGPQDPGVGQCFFHLARIQEQAGDLTAAEPSYNAASSILNPTEGDATPLKAELLLAYGTLYLRMGLGWRAILLLDHARHRFIELGGPDDENVGRSLSMLATAYESAGMEEEALAAYDEALRILRAAWEPGHPSVAYIEWSRADLAFWRAMKSGDSNAVDRALADFQNGLARLEAAFGRDHPDTAQRRAALGSYYVVNNRFEEAARLLSEAIPTLESSGQEVNAYRRQLATARARLGNWDKAFELVRRALREDRIGYRLAHGSERDRMTALETANANLAQYLDLFVRVGKDDASMIEEACNFVLSRKALGAELLAVQRQVASNSDDPELASLLERRADLRARVAQAGLAGEDTGEAFAEIERIEWELVSRIPDMDVTDRLPTFTHESAAALLPDGSVLVEFVRFTRRLTIDVDPEAMDDGSRDGYIAFVIPAGNGAVRVIDFGGAPELDALVRDYRGSLTRPDSAPTTTQRRDFGRSTRHEPQADVGATLRQKLVDPLLGAAGDATRLFIAPDGDLTQLPFEALRDAAGRFLIDTLDISYLSAGRDLRSFASGAERTPGAALVLANPDYDLSSASGPSTSERGSRGATPPSETAPTEREPLRRDLNDSGIRFADLPGTREEAIAVATFLNVEPLLGSAATEDQLKTARSPIILHIATHGFFLPAPPTSSESDDTSHEHVDTAARNPLIRSGIALAGANAWLRGEHLPHPLQDGILNGEDILALDLDATELVVLSACETGLGDTVTGEGVMGLRRAFAVAGARTLIFSLWKVPDAETRLLMTTFYEALIAGKGRAQALREAKLHVRAQHPSPWYWAGFICQGDPAPVQKLARGSTSPRIV